jgi:hypothetical protein
VCVIQQQKLKEVLGFLFYNFRIVVGVGWPVPSQAEQHETPESNLIVVVVVIVAVRMGRKEKKKNGREKKHNHQSKREEEIKIRWKECGEREKIIDGCDDGFRYNHVPTTSDHRSPFISSGQNKTLISWKDFLVGGEREKNKRRKGIFWWDV